MEKKLKRVEGYNNLYRNEHGNIINTDEAAYRAYLKKKNSTKIKDEQISSLSAQLQEAKEEMEELRELVRKVLQAK